MSYTLKIGRRARHDLAALHRWVSDAADVDTADSYIRRVDATMQSLRHFPHRGTSRLSIQPRLQTITFERRLVIAYLVDAGQVEIVRLFDARRDWPRLLR